MAYKSAIAKQDLRIFVRSKSSASAYNAIIPAGREFLAADDHESEQLKLNNRVQPFLPILWRDGEKLTVVGFVLLEDYQAAEVSRA